MAGLGTRFLPATKAMSKEMLPVVDPPIQHVVYASHNDEKLALNDLLLLDTEMHLEAP